jgi:NADH:ubiquinone oxidoreductase subunit 2 (subunit N)
MLPIGQPVSLLGRAFLIGEQFSILGRDFILLNTDRGLLVMMYFFVTVWIIGAWFARPPEIFVPFVLVWAALLIAALAVEPFLYAALLFEICVLLAVPMLSPPQQAPGPGIFRFLTYQSLGMPLILLAGWFLSGLETSPGQTGLALRAGLLIGVGLAFLLSVIPFHTWIPSLARETHPYALAFVLFMMPIMVGVFGLGFIDQFVWLREAPGLYQGLRLVGGVMVLVGGIWAAVENHLGRMLGFGAIIETGITLVGIGVGYPDGVLLFFWLVVVRVFSFVPWAAAVSRIWNRFDGKLDLEYLRGRGHQVPLTAGMAILGQLSLAGVPLLAGFSARYTLFRELGGLSPLAGGMVLLGTVGLLVGAVRTLNSLFIPLPEEANLVDTTGGILSREGSVVSERLFEWITYVLLLLLLAVVGLLPQLYLPWVEKLLLLFERIGG